MMKKVLKVLVIVIVVGFLVMQLFRIDKTAPPVVEAETLESAVTVPDNIRSILERSCNDCHSNKTRYPWYSNVAPMSWFLASHIDDGRRQLNFSIFNTYTATKKVKRLEDICDQVESKEMPLDSYLWIHWDAVLSDGDVKVLCDWANREEEKIKP